MSAKRQKLSNAAKQRLYRMKKKDRRQIARSFAAAEQKRNSRKLSDHIHNVQVLNKPSHLNHEEKEEVICRFETEMKKMKHQFCKECMCVSLMLEMSSIAHICKKCKQKPNGFNITNNLLPIWRDNNDNIQYEVPEELKDLSDAEKMLIQRVSPFIPLHHVKNGTMGIKGHVCSFPQDISEICTKLPRLPQDVSIVKLVHTYQQEIGGDMCHKAFKVRRAKVLTALHWLKCHHQGYKDIYICESNFDWMEGTDETQLPVTEYTSQNNEVFDLDRGPAENQTMQPLREAGGTEQAF